MPINKVEYGNTTLIDLTSDTVSEDTLLKGYTAHDKSGNVITGTYTNQIDPYEYDYIPGYVNGTTWKYENSTNNRSDFYTVEADHRYLLSLGASVGTRFRACIIAKDPVGSTKDISGTQIINKTNPNAYDYVYFKASIDGYLAVTKENTSRSGFFSYLYDCTPEE